MIQVLVLNNKKYNINDLHKFVNSQKLKSINIKLEKFTPQLKQNLYSSMSMLDIIYETKTIQESNLKYPIIIGETYTIYDGRHRLMKAFLNNKKEIKCIIISKKILNNFLIN